MEGKCKGSVLFVGGVHGVGKSSVARDVGQALGIESVAASQLISESLKGEQTWDSEKKVGAIEENQRLLTQAVTNRITDGEPLIVDGHFSLLDSEGKIKEVPVETFVNMGIRLLVLLWDEPSEIALRISERDGVFHNLEALEGMQSVERTHAFRTANLLGIKLVEARATSRGAVETIVSHWKELCK